MVFLLSMLFVACPDPEMFLTRETYPPFQVMSLMSLMSLMTMVMHYQHWHRTQYQQSRRIQTMTRRGERRRGRGQKLWGSRTLEEGAA